MGRQCSWWWSCNHRWHATSWRSTRTPSHSSLSVEVIYPIRDVNASWLANEFDDTHTSLILSKRQRKQVGISYSHIDYWWSCGAERNTKGTKVGITQDDYGHWMNERRSMYFFLSFRTCWIVCFWTRWLCTFLQTHYTGPRSAENEIYLFSLNWLNENYLMIESTPSIYRHLLVNVSRIDNKSIPTKQ